MSVYYVMCVLCVLCVVFVWRALRYVFFLFGVIGCLGISFSSMFASMDDYLTASFQYTKFPLLHRLQIGTPSSRFVSPQSTPCLVSGYAEMITTAGLQSIYTHLPTISSRVCLNDWHWPAFSTFLSAAIPLATYSRRQNSSKRSPSRKKKQQRWKGFTICTADCQPHAILKSFQGCFGLKWGNGENSTSVNCSYMFHFLPDAHVNIQNI